MELLPRAFGFMPAVADSLVFVSWREQKCASNEHHAEIAAHIKAIAHK